jgi:predicted nucleic acid-binding protein
MKKPAALVCAALFIVSVVHAQTEITIKRVHSSINAGFRAQIYIDGNNKVSLVNGQELKLTVSDGEHRIRAALSTSTSNEVRFNTRNGHLSFVITPKSAQQLVIEQQGDGTGNNVPGNNAPAAAANQNESVEGSLQRAAGKIVETVPAGSKVAVVYVTAADPDLVEYIAGELEFILVDQGLTVIDRSQLDRIRREQEFQMSGEVDDNEAVSIGKMAGANIIITGAVTGTGNLRRLRLRALDTQSAQVLVAASERF